MLPAMSLETQRRHANALCALALQRPEGNLKLAQKGKTRIESPPWDAKPTFTCERDGLPTTIVSNELPVVRRPLTANVVNRRELSTADAPSQIG